MKLITLVLSLALVFVTFCVRAAEPSPRIAELQAGLAELEYDPGPVDGLLGSKTREPIMAFQKDQGLMVDGEYSDDLSWLVDVEMHKRQKEPQRKALLKVSNDELIKLIESVSEDEVRRIWELVPERFADLPIRSVFGKWLPPSGEIVFSIPLRLLLYPPSREGVKQFQTDIGAEVTGELTLRQFHEGHRRWLRQRDTVNTSKIDCDRARRECLIADADASIPSPDSDDDSYILHVGLQRHEIISWAAGVIVARRINAICTTEIFTLNSNSKKVYEMVTNNETQECREFRELSVASPQLDKHRIARLAESPATMREFWRKRQKATNSYLNPRVAEGIKQAWKAAQLLRLPGPAR
jgi:hypothetical protein